MFRPASDRLARVEVSRACRGWPARSARLVAWSRRSVATASPSATLDGPVGNSTRIESLPPIAETHTTQGAEPGGRSTPLRSCAMAACLIPACAGHLRLRKLRSAASVPRVARLPEAQCCPPERIRLDHAIVGRLGVRVGLIGLRPVVVRGGRSRAEAEVRPPFDHDPGSSSRRGAHPGARGPPPDQRGDRPPSRGQGTSSPDRRAGVSMGFMGQAPRQMVPPSAPGLSNNDVPGFMVDDLDRTVFTDQGHAVSLSDFRYQGHAGWRPESGEEQASIRAVVGSAPSLAANSSASTVIRGSSRDRLSVRGISAASPAAS